MVTMLVAFVDFTVFLELDLLVQVYPDVCKLEVMLSVQNGLLLLLLASVSI